MRVCDYIASYLYDYGVKNVYGLMGGGASGLNDGFIKHGKIKYICFHHEQGAGYAGYAEAKSTNKLSVVNPTTGCGGTNCMTPLLNSWQDSIPVLFLSGNVRLNHTSNYINKTKGVSIRKYGVQEHDITNSVKSITKFAKVIEKVEDVKRILEEALYIATTGRPGPVWLDIPSDIQTAEMPIESDSFISGNYVPSNPNNILTIAYKTFSEMLEKSNRPIILAGNGIHLSDSREIFKDFVEYHNTPFVSSYLGRDIMEYEHRLNLGAIGIKGTRAANFALHYCDLLLILGCSLNATHMGYDESQFSPYSFKIMVDIDANELFKLKGPVNIDRTYCLNLKDFFDEYEIRKK